MERVRRKLVRLLFVSSGVMIVGFAAVLIAVVYRVSGEHALDDVAPRPAVALALSAADVASASVSGDHLVIIVSGAAPRIEVRSLLSGALVRRFDLLGARNDPAPEDAGAAGEEAAAQ